MSERARGGERREIRERGGRKDGERSERGRGEERKGEHYEIIR